MREIPHTIIMPHINISNILGRLYNFLRIRTQGASQVITVTGWQSAGACREKTIERWDRESLYLCVSLCLGDCVCVGGELGRDYRLDWTVLSCCCTDRPTHRPGHQQDWGQYSYANPPHSVRPVNTVSGAGSVDHHYYPISRAKYMYCNSVIAGRKKHCEFPPVTVVKQQ